MNLAKTDACSKPALTARKGTHYSLGNSGFTMVELIVVSAIIAILASLAIPTYYTIKDKARTVRCMTEIREIEKLVNAYALDHAGSYPSTATWLTELGQSTLVDPWGIAYQYNNNVADAGNARPGPVPGDPLNTDFDLYSKGADRDSIWGNIEADLSHDDVVRAGEGSFVGTLQQF